MSSLRLQYLNGPRRGTKQSFPAPRVRIGRSHDNDLVVVEPESPLASAHHAEARFESGGWYLVDLASTNHTFVNNAQVARAPLRSGDRIGIGSQVLQVRIGPGPLRWAVPAAIALVALASLALLILRSRPPSFEEIAARAAESVYLIAIDTGQSRAVTGTAFAIDGNRALLATNAHVADQLRQRTKLGSASGSTGVAVRSDSFDASPVSRFWIDPQWRAGALDHDVALLQLAAGTHVTALRLGSDRSIERLRRGVTLASFGFPAVGTDARRPRGRLAVDVIGDVRLPFVEVGLAISPGTSGSPVFDRSGDVIGIVVGGDFVDGPDGSGKRPSGTSVNWVIVSTALRDLLDAHRAAY